MYANDRAALLQDSAYVVIGNILSQIKMCNNHKAPSKHLHPFVGVSVYIVFMKEKLASVLTLCICMKQEDPSWANNVISVCMNALFLAIIKARHIKINSKVTVHHTQVK